jgi:hypothetical protein
VHILRVDVDVLEEVVEHVPDNDRHINRAGHIFKQNFQNEKCYFLNVVHQNKMYYDNLGQKYCKIFFGFMSFHPELVFTKFNQIAVLLDLHNFHAPSCPPIRFPCVKA